MTAITGEEPDHWHDRSGRHRGYGRDETHWTAQAYDQHIRQHAAVDAGPDESDELQVRAYRARELVLSALRKSDLLIVSLKARNDPELSN